MQTLSYGTCTPTQVSKHGVQPSKSALLCLELCINFLLLRNKLPLA